MSVKNALIQLNGVTAQLIIKREQLDEQLQGIDPDDEDQYLPLANEYIDIDSTIEILVDAIEQIKTYK